MAKRNAVEAAADLLDRFVGRKSRCHAVSAFDKQFHRCIDPQRLHRPELLLRDAQSLAAGGQDLHRRRLREDSLHEIRGCVEHMLAVVEHQ